jgi:hypothetical protein
MFKVMLDGEKFLILVTDPLQLMLQSRLAAEGNVTWDSTTDPLVYTHDTWYEPTIVYNDPQSAFCAMTNDIAGVEIDTGGAGDYIDKVDTKISYIKETYRSIKSGLAWELPKTKVKDLVVYVISRLNLCHAMVRFTDVKPNWEK